MSRTDATRALRSRLRQEEGFLLIEVLAAILILTVGIFGLLAGFATAQKLSLVSEKQSSTSHVAQREIERIQGLPYASIALTSTPSYVADTSSPDQYVTTIGSSATPAFEWNRDQASAEALVIDTSAGTLPTEQAWSEGGLSGTIYDFVTWSTDTGCSPGCPAANDYKRVTVVVTVTGPNPPSPIYDSTLIANPDAGAAKGTANGTAGNPITSGATTCATVSGGVSTQGACESPIDAGVANTFFLHDCAATAACSAPTAAHALHDTVGTISGLTCELGLTSLSGVPSSELSGCPVPDTMDPTVPANNTSIVQYSTDLGTSGYVGGRLLQPLCGSGQICGSGSTSDCNASVAWTSSLLNAQNELWVTSPVSSDTSLTGEGALNLFTQTQGGTNAVVTLCVELYEIPPSGGVAGSLADLLSWPPTAIGGAGFVAPTDPTTGANWPTSPSNVEYEFNFASAGVTVPAGDRIGIRVWMVANVNNAIALLYDNANDPSELQLNSTSSPIALSAT